MRNWKREVTDPATIAEMLEHGQVLHLAMCDEGAPYVVPLTYGWRDGVAWAHCATEGRKLDVLARDPRVCFDITLEAEVVRTGRPCRWSTRYRSLIGFGTARVVTEGPELREGLSVLVAAFGGDPDQLPEDLGRVAVIRIDVESLTAKASEG